MITSSQTIQRGDTAWSLVFSSHVGCFRRGFFSVCPLHPRADAAVRELFFFFFFLTSCVGGFRGVMKRTAEHGTRWMALTGGAASDKWALSRATRRLAADMLFLFFVSGRAAAMGSC